MVGKGKFWSVLFITIMLILSGCSGSAVSNSKSNSSGEKDTIKIGVILSSTGTFAPLAESIKNGFNLYLEENDNKLGGKKVEIKFEDDEANPQVALRKYRQLVKNEKVDILVGPISSAVAYALRDEVEKDKIILIDANAAGNDLSWSKKSDYIYRLSFSNWQNGSSAGEYLAKNVGKTAVAIAPDYPAGKEVVSAFKEAFEAAGGKVVKEIYPKLGTNDFATYLTDVAQVKPELVFTFMAGSDGIRFVQQYNDFGLKGKIPLSGPMEFGDQLILEPTGEAAEGIISGILYSPWLENEENKKFVEAYQEKYGKLPNTFSVGGYDSAKVIDIAIKEAGSTNAEDLIKVLKGISFDSPRGPITIDPKTNNPIQNFYIAKNTKKDNQIVPEVLETAEKVTMPEKAPAN
ncbi:ABC transporter substrate-binding protein [Aeribacillus sp. FSL K6-2848]|uniref:ABC transporter substrate-binding protein n=1 Tax=unclassified Aeribacillus TaxID=2640495 RepID=UPI0028710C3D|nr:ABC transporter substrate-binding protein [Aeribacillus pallidus]